jgi:hypothetical protein
MVQDGIEWFGETQTWSIAVSSGGTCATGPLATPSDRWKLEFFDNKTLSGTAVEELYDAVGGGGFGFDWGSGRASNCAGVDNFGVRFSRTISVGAGADYKFTTTTDDGVRLWVDGQLLIDRWKEGQPFLVGPSAPDRTPGTFARSRARGNALPTQAAAPTQPRGSPRPRLRIRIE